MKKVFVWGAGFQGGRLKRKGAFNECQILGFIDCYKTNNIYEEIPVYRPEEIINEDYDYIIISNENPIEILDLCKDYGIESEKIIVVFNYVFKNLQFKNQDEELIRKEMPSLVDFIIEGKRKATLCSNIYTCNYDMKDSGMLLGKGRFTGEYMKDYFRYRTFELVVHELKKLENQDWNCAELGVFKGVFSALINSHFNSKKLYMFDTFEGFSDEEAKKEMKEGRCDEEMVKYFSINDVEEVYNSMPYKEQCIIRKGLFPESSKGLEDEKFGFVSLDVDFYNSTLKGLEFFYPRMIKGGYIFVHDYNHNSLEGVKQAVLDYEKRIGTYLKKVPLADSNGSIVLIK